MNEHMLVHYSVLHNDDCIIAKIFQRKDITLTRNRVIRICKYPSAICIGLLLGTMCCL